MNLKKIGIGLVVILFLSLIVFTKNRSKNFYSHIGIGCYVENYSQEENLGYITLRFNDTKNTIKRVRVEDKKLQKQLSQINILDVIGVNILMTLPKEKIENSHIDRCDIDVFDLLYGTDEYDEYLIVTGISLK